MVQVVEGLIRGFREQLNRPVPKTKYAPDRLLIQRNISNKRSWKNERRKTVVCWHDKKHFVLLNTEVLSKLIRYASKQNQEHTMSELVRDYNLYMV